MAEAFNSQDAAAAQDDQAVIDVDRAGLSILIVDDDPADQALCEILLLQGDSTRKVERVAKGNEALKALSAADTDCVLLDYHLLDGKADTYIEQITALDPWLPIVMLSGSGNDHQAARAMQLGASDYLSKDRVTVLSLNRSITNAITKAELSRKLHLERQELIAANLELRKQRREIQSFYHTVSHELKTPITAIREFCSLMNDGILGPVNTEQVDVLETSIDCCDRLTRLVHDLFDAARIETGKLELHREDVDLHELMEREVKIMRTRAREQRISLVYAHEAELPTLYADPNRLSQLICNLISNAIKYTDRGGKVSVSISHDSETQCIKVKVADNGFGIAAEHADFIFDRLYQCDNPDVPDASSQNGMGIGLYLCSQIVALHDGEISVDSKLGAGSTFTFTLPVTSSR